MSDTFAVAYPHLLKFWSSNNGFTPDSITAKSGREVLFKCEKEHEWSRPARKMARFPGCPYCSGKKLLTGFNDLGTLHERFVQEFWDFEKNDFLPGAVTSKDTLKRVNLRCRLGHCWSESVNKAVNSVVPCPFCGGRELLRGFNDFKTLHPELLQFWDFENNSTITAPDEVRANSTEKVWWKCSRGHRLLKAINRKVLVPICSQCKGVVITPGVNDLATTDKEFLAIWDFEKNSFSPQEVGKGSNRQVHWLCPDCGHEWSTNLNNKQNSGCPRCSKWGTSFLESEVSDFLESLTPSRILRNDRKTISPKELDVVFPDLGLAFEVHGNYWHSDSFSFKNFGVSESDRNLAKRTLVALSGIKLYFVWEDDWRQKRSSVENALSETIAGSEDCSGMLTRTSPSPD